LSPIETPPLSPMSHLAKLTTYRDFKMQIIEQSSSHTWSPNRLDSQFKWVSLIFLDVSYPASNQYD
jgi:hypothetical protein